MAEIAGMNVNISGAMRAKKTRAKNAGSAVPVLPTRLVENMFVQAGVELRHGRSAAIAALLGPTLARFRSHTWHLPFEREPGLFPVEPAIARMRKKAGDRR